MKQNSQNQKEFNLRGSSNSKRDFLYRLQVLESIIHHKDNNDYEKIIFFFFFGAKFTMRRKEERSASVVEYYT